MVFTRLGAAAILALSVSAASAGESDFEITGDATKGEKVFKKCKACHAVGDGAKARVGPALNGMLGRAAGSQDGFKYSKAMQQAGTDGLAWTPETLAEFLAKPKAFIEGTKMSFPGLRKEADQENIIAYLATFNSEEEGS